MGNKNSHGGRHVIIECFGCRLTSNESKLESLLRRAATAGDAKILSCHMHSFGSKSGLTGVLLLAESHISVHTWPEREYAAFDVFMCGNCDPDAAAEVIADGCTAGAVTIRAFNRPLSPDRLEQA